ncbi:MAG: DNA-directed RNA polymerase subunit omega [Spirochaetia bacterium]|nr:DNA-directed RNA polymerase subunit omega [Spirochaetia bacterium]MCF7941932.1 DNA-directed RNA polymerase subunit omega [Spirochaetia bacterium]
MSIPLDLLVDRQTNTYEMTCVAIRNAEKIAKKGEQEVIEQGDKVVSASLSQVLTDSVKYDRNEQE